MSQLRPVGDQITAIKKKLFEGIAQQASQLYMNRSDIARLARLPNLVIDDLFDGELDKFSIDRLVRILAVMDAEVTVEWEWIWVQK